MPLCTHPPGQAGPPERSFSPVCKVQSSTHETKSKTSLTYKKERFYIASNSFNEDIPVRVQRTMMQLARMHLAAFAVRIRTDRQVNVRIAEVG